jgi:hypothetical protein
LADSLEKKEAQLNEVLSASNLDPASLSVVTRKLEVNKLFLSRTFKRDLSLGSTRRQKYIGKDYCATKFDTKSFFVIDSRFTIRIGSCL